MVLQIILTLIHIFIKTAILYLFEKHIYAFSGWIILKTLVSSEEYEL